MEHQTNPERKEFILRWVNVLAVASVILFNGLANALPFNGLTTGEISDRFVVYFVPAGYVFSIWGVIYIGLIAFAVYQVLPSQRQNARLCSLGYLFALSCLANIIWLFCWHYLLFELTVVFMLVLLGLLIAIYLRLEIGRAQVPAAERWFVQLPFSIYLGWISVATIANLSDVLWYRGWNGEPWQPEIWAVIMLAVGVGLAFAMTVLRADIAFVIVLLWAYTGIAIKQTDTPIVANTAWAGVVALAVLAVAALIRGARVRRAV